MASPDVGGIGAVGGRNTWDQPCHPSLLIIMILGKLNERFK
jgi:hypothetical protein